MLGVLFVGLALAQEGTVSMGTSDAYVIQPGDTLWDISQRFLGDAQAWPELWSVNEYITNPHWIYPGNKIYFRLGDALTPPSAGVEPGSTQTSVVRAQVTEADDSCDLPPRFDAAYRGVKVSAPGFIGDNDSLGIRGKVYGSWAGGQTIGEGAIVHLRVRDAASIECGALLGIYRKNPRMVRGAGGAIGRVHRQLAVAQVLRVDGDIATARLRESWAEVYRGDLVGEYLPVDLELDVGAPAGDLDARIVARLHEDENVLSNIGETVFLDRGTDAGVDVGQSLFVVERRDGAKMFDPREDQRLPEAVVGRVVVVRAEAGHSTGVVVDAARDIQVGARVTTIPNRGE